MHLSRLQFIIVFLILVIQSSLYSQINNYTNVAAAAANTFAYPQSIYVDSPNGHVWITDFDNHRVLRFDVSILTNIGKGFEENIASEYVLDQNYPNPFNPTTQISFSVRKTSQATLTVYNLLGQEVAVLFNGIATSTTAYSIIFDAKSLPSGMYMYSLRTSGGSEVKKMCLLK